VLQVERRVRPPHTVEQVVDPVLDFRWEEYVGHWNHAEWRDVLAAGMEGGGCDAVRRATSTGEPLGVREFVTAMEEEAGRRLRVLARGRPRKRAEDAGQLTQ
jgi:hypothetical protein